MSDSAFRRTADVPPHRTDDDVLGLAEDLSRLGQAGSLVGQFIEEQLDLDQRALTVLAGVAARGGSQVADDREVLLDLQRRELVTRFEDDVAFVVTERGKMVLDQAQAMRIRAADHLVNELGPGQTRSLRDSVQLMVQSFPRPACSTA